MKKKTPPATRSVADRIIERHFTEVAAIIADGRRNALSTINAILIETYWQVGRYISQKIKLAGWGDGIVRQLADYLQKVVPDHRGLSARNLWRMMQFHDNYSSYEKVSTLLTQLPWSSHLLIISKARSEEERLFYLELSVKERFSVRDLDHAIKSCLFERALTNPPKLSTVLRQLQPVAETLLRDSYTLNFLGLPPDHSEYDLRNGIVRSLKNFIIEFGRDFAFIGEEYRVQVGMQDFFIDLLFFHRELQCLVAFELKVDEFKPEYLGKLSFYLEALDRDVKKPHEKPSIGIILCKGKDEDIVEYALARTTSPAAIAEYATKLPDRKLLQSKLHEFFDSSVREMQAEYGKNV